MRKREETYGSCVCEVEAHEVYRRLGFDSKKEQKRFSKKIDKDVEI